MNIYKFSVERPVAVTVILLGIVVIGLLYIGQINIEAFPKMEVPVASIMTLYPGAGPEEIEQQISKPIEEQVGSVSGLKQISSTSIENVSIVIAEFYYGTNMDLAMANIREKLDVVKPKLPDGAKTPAASALDPSQSPIMILAFYGKQDTKELRTLADNDIKPMFEQLPGVGSITITGGKERIIQIAADKDKMQSMGIPPIDIIQAISRENINLPAGKIIGKYQEYGLRSKGEFQSLQDIEKVCVAVKNGVPVYVRDIAKVIDSNKEITTLSKYIDNTDKQKGIQSTECITLEIRRNETANIVTVAKLVEKEINRINKTLPEGCGIYVAYNNAEFIKEAIHNLEATAVEGAILAVIILFLFLASIRSTFVITLSIPISIIATFLIMFFTDITINMITLTALILGIGRIVDDSIVVLENIFRYMEEGYPPFQAAIEGTKEVGLAVTAATFTTISVFFPLFLIKGIAGQIFSPLSKTYAYALLMSLLVAVTAIPMLSSRILVNEKKAKEKKGIINNFLVKFNNLFERLSLSYRAVLKWSLSHRKLVVFIALISFIGSLFMLPFIPKSLMEKWDRGDFVVDIEAPQGSSIERTENLLEKVENIVVKNIPELETIIASVGKPAGETRMSTSAGSQSNLGGLTVKICPKSERKRSVYKVMKEIEAPLSKIAGVKVTVSEMFTITGQKPLAINIKGQDMERLTKIANTLLDKFKDIDGLKNVDLNWRSGNPEYQFVLDREKVASLDLGYSEVSSTLRQLLAEDKISVFRDKGKEFDIVLQIPKDKRSTISDIMKMTIKPSGKDSADIPLGSLVTVNLTTGPNEISRMDRTRFISIESELEDGTSLTDATSKVIPILNNYNFPPGYSWEIAGEEKERQEIFGQMFTVLWLAIIFVYVILAVQFESFIHPFTIMLAIPLELIGVFSFFMLTRTPISMFGLLGLIMLTGIVVSNSILLVNYIIVLRGKGLDKNEAILQAGPIRLRPILMTASCTIFAMIPLALGLRSGSEMFANLAKGVIGGLITSTALTLIVIPVVYSLLDELGPRTKSFLNKISVKLSVLKKGRGEIKNTKL